MDDDDTIRKKKIGALAYKTNFLSLFNLILPLSLFPSLISLSLFLLLSLIFFSFSSSISLSFSHSGSAFLALSLLCSTVFLSDIFKFFHN